MSLYNELFGINPYAAALLLVLGTRAAAIPRFRDCYLDADGNIVIFTRTGGGNRADYERTRDAGTNDSGLWNDDLRALPGFLKDEDDGWDATYARFHFEPPSDFADLMPGIAAAQGEYDPMGRFEAMLDDLQAQRDTPDTRRAVEVGESIFRNLAKAPSGGVVKV